MIIVRLMGGLGNQMFQYALGKRLAVERKEALLLDLGWFENQEKRYYELNQFNIKAEIATNADFDKFQIFSHNRYTKKIRNHIERYLPYYLRSEFFEQKDGYFDPHVLKVKGNKIFSGYWQSEKYFKSIENEIKDNFSLKQNLSEEVSSLCKGIEQKNNSISIHIRRGDYINESTGHCNCSIDYYQRAIEFIKININSPILYFFSDDISWVKRNITFEYQSIYIETNHKSSIDLFLMSKCHHHIIANSSYSWWGAWLGDTKDSITIAPNIWFTDKPYPKDTIPDRWIRI
jgi:hypothetical protein